MKLYSFILIIFLCLYFRKSFAQHKYRLAVVIFLYSSFLFQSVYAVEKSAEKKIEALPFPVDNIIGVYPASGSSGIDPEDITLIIQYSTISDYEYTDNNTLTIHDIDTGEQIFTIDPEKEDPQQGLDSFRVKLGSDVLQRDKRYSVTVDHRFAVINRSPWKTGEIIEGQWVFETAANSLSTTNDFSLLNIDGATPEELLTDNGFEESTDFLDLSETRGSAYRINDNAISGGYSLAVELGNYGRVTAAHYYPYDADIFSKALQVYAKFMLPEDNAPRASLRLCSVAYYFNQERVEKCQPILGTQTGLVAVNVVLELDPTRKVSRVYNWIDSVEHGPFKAIVDDLHLVMYRKRSAADDSGEDDVGDSDGDGVTDDVDAFPHDDTEWQDSDGDGVGDNSDAFPDDATESNDSDDDGVGDNSDAFPDDATESNDSDGDGVGDNSDAFPDDATESNDSDGDGVGDNSDAFPDDATESNDSDGDGVGDNSDAFPDDATESNDSDGDGVGDNSDAFPNDATRSDDSDGGDVGGPIENGQEINPIIFVSQLPIMNDFAASLATFANHFTGTNNAGRGGDLYIRYPDGTLKNLTRLAGYGEAAEDQRENAIAVRDPAVHWSGNKAIFSMVIGAPERYRRPEYYWQMYEVTGLGKDEIPTITKVLNQPRNYNNIGAVYGTDDRIIFASDMPLKGKRHLYPQHDEYESTPTVTGLFSLDPISGDIFRMVDSPSGSFDPIVALDGRVLMTQWDHLKRDQQADLDNEYEARGIPLRHGTFNFSDESETADKLRNSRKEFYPEPRTVVLPEGSHFTGHDMSIFLPWQVEQDGSEMEMLNHVGRHELLSFIDRRVVNDPNVTAQFFTQGANENRIHNFFQLAEDPTNPGIFYGVDSGEFATLGSGQIIRLNGHEEVNANQVQIQYVTSRNSRSTEADPSIAGGNQGEGHYRDPLPLSNGQIIAAHTDAQGELINQGSATKPNPNFNFRLKFLTKNESGYWRAESLVTSGIRRTLNYYSPDNLVVFNDVEMWEVQPVEVVSRRRPYARSHDLPQPEQEVFFEEGVNLSDVKAYLKKNDLALVVSRNLTARDENDKQQPYNLCVADSNNPCDETSTKTISDEGKVYDISHLQFFQADRLRGIGGVQNPKPGRRVLAVPMHSSQAFNLPDTSSPSGSVKIAEDGSMAALVPARRAMSWQLTNETGESIVAERFWLSFQPGEVRVCASCHGVNERDQIQRPMPKNKPEALRKMLNHIKLLMSETHTRN